MAEVGAAYSDWVPQLVPSFGQFIESSSSELVSLVVVSRARGGSKLVGSSIKEDEEDEGDGGEDEDDDDEDEIEVLEGFIYRCLTQVVGLTASLREVSFSNNESLLRTTVT